MIDLPTAQDLSELAKFVAPGLLMIGIRSRYQEGLEPRFTERALTFAVFSVIYYAFSGPLFQVPGGIKLPQWLWSMSHYFLLPCALGLLLAYIDRKRWFYKISSTLGLNPTHHIPAAWDYAFSQLKQGTYVWIKLTDGTEYAGIIGANSFLSSVPSERDLFLEEVWEVNGNEKPWTRKEPRRGVLICSPFIQRVEIFSGV